MAVLLFSIFTPLNVSIHKNRHYHPQNADREFEKNEKKNKYKETGAQLCLQGNKWI